MFPKPECEKEAVRKVIALIKPDILVLQEMGSEPFLKELQDDLRREGINFEHTFLMKGADPIRHIAVLSKEPIIQGISYDGLNFSYLKNEKALVRRGLLELKFKTEGIEWSLFGVHLKSRRTEGNKDFESSKQRLGEAGVIRDKIEERYSDPKMGYYMIVGDFNDYAKSKTMKRFLNSGKRELFVMLPAVDSREEVWTHFRKGYGNYSQIDYILVSPTLLSKVKAKRAFIVDALFALRGSDHRMVYTDLDF